MTNYHTFLLLLCLFIVAEGQFISFRDANGKVLGMPGQQGYITAVPFNPLDKTQQWNLVSSQYFGEGFFVTSRHDSSFVMDVSLTNGVAVSGSRLVAYARKGTPAETLNQRFLYNGTSLVPVVNKNLAISIAGSGLVQLASKSSSTTSFTTLGAYPVVVELPKDATVKIVGGGSSQFYVELINVPITEPDRVITVTPGTPVTRSFLVGTVLQARDGLGNIYTPDPFNVVGDATVTFTPGIAPTYPPGYSSTCNDFVNPYTDINWQIHNLGYAYTELAGIAYMVGFCGVPQCSIDNEYSAACERPRTSLGRVDNAEVNFVSANQLRMVVYGGSDEIDGGCFDLVPRGKTSIILINCTNSLGLDMTLTIIGNCYYHFAISLPVEYCS